MEGNPNPKDQKMQHFFRWSFLKRASIMTDREDIDHYAMPVVLLLKMLFG